MVDVQILIKQDGTFAELARLDLALVPRIKERIALIVYDPTTEKEIYFSSYEVLDVLHYIHAAPVVPIGPLNFIEYNSDQNYPTVRLVVERQETQHELAAQLSFRPFKKFLYHIFEFYQSLGKGLAFKILELAKQGRRL